MTCLMLLYICWLVEHFAGVYINLTDCRRQLPMYLNHDLSRTGLYIEIYYYVLNMRNDTVVSLFIGVDQSALQLIRLIRFLLLKTRRVHSICSPFAGICRATAVFWRKTFWQHCRLYPLPGWRSRVSHR